MVSNISTNYLPYPPLNSNTLSSQGHGRELANLAKIYIDKAKYNSKNNSFSFKFVIFYNICAKTDVSQEILLKTFPIMLTNLALNYYYLNISISITTTFDKVYELIQTYFKGVEYKRSILSK